jgi:hypothetical protein
MSKYQRLRPQGYERQQIIPEEGVVPAEGDDITGFAANSVT